jgi:hypothetical protein
MIAGVTMLFLTLIAPQGEPIFPSLRVPVGANPIGLVTGDLDGDGDIDAVATNAGGASLTVLLGNGEGFLAPQQTLAVGGAPLSVALGDLDGDGILDLVAACKDAGSVSVALGNGDGTFAPAASISVGAQPVSVVLDHFDIDGALDMAVSATAGGFVAVLAGAGDGTFGPPDQVDTLGAEPYALASGDVSGDGLSDLIVGHYDVNVVQVLLGDGAGGFLPGAMLTASTRTLALVVADMNGDGLADVVSCSDANSGVAIFHGVGSGGFGAKLVVAGGFLTSPQGMAVGDVDIDGDLDLAVSLGGPVRARVVLQDDQGGFAIGADLRTSGNGPREAALVDLNGDALPELLIACASESAVTVLRGTGDPIYEEALEVDLNLSAGAVTVADLDGDGLGDVVVLGNDGVGVPLVHIFPGDGDVDLDTQLTLIVHELAGSSRAILAADLTGDGLPDLAAVEINADVLVLLPGLGGFDFGEPVVMPTDADPDWLTSADFDGDGLPDLAFSHEEQGVVSVQLGDGLGGFGAASVHAVGERPMLVLTGDLDGDGAFDLLTANRNSDDLSVLLGDGAGGFGPAVSVPADEYPQHAVLADFDEDDVADVAVANLVADTVLVLPGLGDGSFGPPLSMDVPNPRWVGSADVNRDGYVDLVAIGQRLYVFLGRGAEGFVDGGMYAPRPNALNSGTAALADVDADGAPELLYFAGDLDLVRNQSDAWTELGHALAGSAGAPALNGTGSLVPGTPVTLSLTHAPSFAPASLVVGLSELGAPFKGGVMVPHPDVILALATDAGGGVFLAAPWPAGLPSGIGLLVQYWVVDLAGPAGFAASNALRGTTP